MHLASMLCIKLLAIVSTVPSNSPFSPVPLKVCLFVSSLLLASRSFRAGHIAGGFARHRYDLKTQMQQQAAAAAAAAALAAQQHAADKSGTSVGRGEGAGGVVQHLVHQIQHHPHTSSSSQRASTSMSALR